MLHAVRIRGRAPLPAVIAAVGSTLDAVALLEAAAAEGLVQLHQGRAAGWSLTPAGRERHAVLLAEDRAGCATVELHGAYERFLVLNEMLIELCTRWQVRPDGAPNAHDDAGYDAALVEELAGLDARAQPICRAAGTAHERMLPYGPRLADAVERVGGGEVAWFTSPAVDSYHTVWFELHEDFLQTLGIPRSSV